MHDFIFWSKEVEGKLEKMIQELKADLFAQQEKLTHKDDVIKQLESTICEQLQRLDQFASDSAILQHEATLQAELYHQECQFLKNKLLDVDEEKNTLSKSMISFQQDLAAQRLEIHQLEEKFAVACKETQAAQENVIILKAQLGSINKELEETKYSMSAEILNITEQLTVQGREKFAIESSYQESCKQIENMNMLHASELEKMKSDIECAKNEVQIWERKVHDIEEELKIKCQECESHCKEISMIAQDIASQQGQNMDLKLRVQILSDNDIKMQSEVMALKQQLSDKEVACNELVEQLNLNKKFHADEIQSVTTCNTSLNEKLEENLSKQDLLLQSHDIEVASYRQQVYMYIE